MRRVMLGLSALLFSLSAHASYVESCALNGVVQSKPNQYRVYFLNNEGLEVERIETRFRYKVTHSIPNGRADSGCVHLIGQTLKVVLNDTVSPPHLRPRYSLKLNYIAKNDRGYPDTITEFELPQR